MQEDEANASSSGVLGAAGDGDELRCRLPSRGETVRRARHLSVQVPRLLYRHRRTTPRAISWELADAVRALRMELGKPPHRDADPSSLAQMCDQLERDIASKMPQARRSAFRDYADSIVVALLVALFIRAFLFEAFKIPTGSMIPTLLAGDHIFVCKFVYGIRIPFTSIRLLPMRKPERGEVVVFEYPGPGEDHGKDFIKRVMAVEGERVRMEDNLVFVDGELSGQPHVLARGKPCLSEPGTACRWRPIVPREGRSALGRMESGCPCTFVAESANGYEWVTQHIDPNASCYCKNGMEGRPEGCNRDSWPLLGTRAGREILELWGGAPAAADRHVYDAGEGRVDMVVPPGYVFVMGDNRDNSHDGRFFGLVPISSIRGKALLIWWATHDRTDRVMRRVH